MFCEVGENVLHWNHRALRWAVAAVGILLALLIPCTVLAADDVYISLNPGGQNLFESMGNMLPGQSHSQTFTLSNTGGKTANFYLTAQSAAANDFAGDEEAFRLSIKLLAQLEMKIEQLQGGNNKLLYEGEANQLAGKPGTPARLVGRRVLLGQLPPGGSIQIRASVSVPETLGNEYDGAQGKFWWLFSSEAQASASSAPPSSLSQSAGVPPPGRTQSTQSESTPSSSDSNLILLPADREDFWKVPNKPRAQAGDTVEYTLSGFYNDTGEAVTHFTISDIFPEGLHFVSAKVPPLANAAGVHYSVVYSTNRAGIRNLHTNLPATSAFTFYAPPLQGGEYITTLSFEFGDVPTDFAKDSQILIDCQIDAAPPSDTLLNRALLFYNQKGKEVALDGGGQGVKIEPIDNLPLPMNARLQGAGLKTSWALVNLVVTVFCLVVALAMLVNLCIRRRQKADTQRQEEAHPNLWDDIFSEEKVGSEAKTQQKAKPWASQVCWLAALVSSVFPLVLFLITQDMRLPMQITDRWTIWMLLLALLQAVLVAATVFLAKRHTPAKPPLSDTALEMAIMKALQDDEEDLFG